MIASKIQQRIRDNTSLENKYCLLCPSCLWTASSFYENFIRRCPMCNSVELDIIPICFDEMVTLDRDLVEKNKNRISKEE